MHEFCGSRDKAHSHVCFAFHASLHKIQLHTYCFSSVLLGQRRDWLSSHIEQQCHDNAYMRVRLCRRQSFVCEFEQKSVSKTLNINKFSVSANICCNVCFIRSLLLFTVKYVRLRLIYIYWFVKNSFKKEGK